MAVISPSDIAFEGLRLAREKPRAVIAWTVLLFLVSLVTVGMVLTTGLRDVMATMDASNRDPNAGLAALVNAGPPGLALLVMGLLVQAVMMSAVYRAVLRPQDSRYGYLRLGLDELRQMGLFLILVGIVMVSFFVIILAGGIIAAVVHGILSAMGPAGTAIGALAGVGIGIWLLCLMIFVVVRLSLAPPLTFATGRLQVLAAWRLSHGKFWRLLGTYSLAVIIYVVIWFMAMVAVALIGGIVGMALGFGLDDVGMIFSPDTSSWAAFLTLPTLVYSLFSAALTALQNAMLFSPSAVAYRVLTTPDPAPESFD